MFAIELDWRCFMHWCISFIVGDFLLQQLLLFVKRKFDIKFKLKLCKCKVPWLLTIICLIFIIYYWKSSTYYTLFSALGLSFVYGFLKQYEDYSDVDVNNCQKDSESIGAFWAHQAFEAYYRIICKNLKDRMISFENEHNIRFLFHKLVIVMPLSCKVEDILTSQDQNIKYIGCLPSIECDQGANVNRQLKNSVYEITLNETLYIAVEYPSSLNTLRKMQESGGLTKEKFIYHRNCFIKTLRLLMKGYPCILVEYDDTVNSVEPLSSFLISRLREKNDVILNL